MKAKSMLIVAILAIAAMQARAQKLVSPGIRAGVNIATISNLDADFKTDFYVGGMATFNFSEKYNLQPELTYTRQGANNVTYTGEGDADPTSENLTLQYLSLGVMNKFYFAEGFHGLVGPSVDMNVGTSFPRMTFSDYKGVDLALTIGLGYTLPMGLTFEGRFKTGLLDALDNDFFAGFFDDPDEIKQNRLFQIGVAYSF